MLSGEPRPARPPMPTTPGTYRWRGVWERVESPGISLLASPPREIVTPAPASPKRDVPTSPPFVPGVYTEANYLYQLRHDFRATAIDRKRFKALGGCPHLELCGCAFPNCRLYGGKASPTRCVDCVLSRRALPAPATGSP